MAVNESLPDEMMNLQVLRLLSAVSDHGNRQLPEIETDLDQMNILLDEAIKKLGASFMAIHKALGRQQQVLSLLLNGQSAPADSVPAIEALQCEIGRHINAAVTGLQFQDLTGQLIGRMAKHLEELRDVFGTLDSAVADMSSGSRNGDVLAMLDNVNSKVDELSVAANGCTKKAVSQRHMESGEIELFINIG